MRIICPECNGSGIIRTPSPYYPKDTTTVWYREYTCDKCEGEGWVELADIYGSDTTIGQQSYETEQII